MSSNRMRRIQKEIADIHNDRISRVDVEPLDPRDVTKLNGSFYGPPDTPYEGGRYEVTIDIPNDYPFKPPIMRFKTKIWHPNVSSQTGMICLDTLGTAWSPVLTIKSALISLQSLLSSPEPKDPQDAVVATQLIKNPEEFKHKATEWAQQYAGAPEKDVSQSSGGATAESLQRQAQQAKADEEEAKTAQYKGFHPALVNRFVAMGFDVPTVVSAFEYVGIDRMDGEDYEMEEAYMGDVTARLFHES